MLPLRTWRARDRGGVTGNVASRGGARQINGRGRGSAFFVSFGHFGSSTESTPKSATGRFGPNRACDGPRSGGRPRYARDPEPFTGRAKADAPGRRRAGAAARAQTVV